MLSHYAGAQAVLNLAAGSSRYSGRKLNLPDLTLPSFYGINERPTALLIDAVGLVPGTNFSQSS